jgi:hypothetical protein
MIPSALLKYQVSFTSQGMHGCNGETRFIQGISQEYTNRCYMGHVFTPEYSNSRVVINNLTNTATEPNYNLCTRLRNTKTYLGILH